MWLYIVGGGALLAGGAIAYAHSKSGAPATAAAPSGPVALPPTTAPIQPPGVPQPRGQVSIPAPPPMDPALHAAAQNLLTYLGTTMPGKGSIPQVKAFQTAYNMSGPSTPLKPDGIYGPKCQAALQSVMGSAPAPAHLQPTAGAVAAAPSIPAAKPIAGVDITGAANVLANMPSPMPKSSDSRVATFQAAYNATPGVTHIIADGKYGGSTQGALESVLNWMGTGLVAPPNSFGLAIVRPKTPYSAGHPYMVPVAAGGLDTLLKNTAKPSTGTQIWSAIAETPGAIDKAWGY